jgi:hypothetical protein
LEEARRMISPEWIGEIGEIGTAIGTIGATVVALVVSVGEARRRRIAKERAQAERVSAWMMDDLAAPQTPDADCQVKLILQNASDQLVYQVIASLVSANTGDLVPGFQTYVGRLPPGRSEYEIPHPGTSMGGRRHGIELAFEDSAGAYWRRSGKGNLERTSKDPIALYEIEPPVHWEMP